jgi:hypothetical protein
MWAREQSVRYLQQYIHARNETPWVTTMCPDIEDRARSALQYLGGIAGDWYGQRSDCTYYYPQRNTNERKV